MVKFLNWNKHKGRKPIAILGTLMQKKKAKNKIFLSLNYAENKVEECLKFYRKFHFYKAHVWVNEADKYLKRSLFSFWRAEDFLARQF